MPRWGLIARVPAWALAVALAAPVAAAPATPVSAMRLAGPGQGTLQAASAGITGAPVLPPDGPPFGAQRRARLASDALIFPGGDDDDYMNGGVFMLPVPLPWPPGANVPRAWELDVPGGAPLFVLAAVAPAGAGFQPGATSITVDGVPVAAPESYAVKGFQLPDANGPIDYTAMALVVPGQEPGRHTVTVACNGCTPGPTTPWTTTVNAGPKTYVLNVKPPRVRAQPYGSDAAGRTDGAAQGPAISIPVVATLPDGQLAGSPDPLTIDPLSGSLTVPAVPEPADAPRSGVVADRDFYSDALGRTMQYRVYLPPGYSDLSADGHPPVQRYPVLYLLHGLGGSMKQWTNVGLVAELDRIAASGGRVPFIVVMPSGQSGYWVNHADGGPRWGDYVAKDLVAHVDASYRTISRRDARGIGGISMGGHGALQLSLTNPDLFGVTGAHSPALRPRTDAPTFLGGFFTGVFGGPGQAAYDVRDPITLVKRASTTAPPVLWVDIGQQDRWLSRASELHNALLARSWRHEWRPDAGDHDGAYWKRHMPDYVAFYLRAFQAVTQ